LLLHISAKSHSHLQGAKNVQDTYRVLCRLSIATGKMFAHVSAIHAHSIIKTVLKIITHMKYQNYIKCSIQTSGDGGEVSGF